MKTALGILVAAAPLVFAQDWAREVEALRPQTPPAGDRVFLDELENHAKESLAAIHHAQTPEEAAQARPKLRTRLEQALGLPKMPWPPELRARRTGTVIRPGYRIEKIVYEALPGEPVAAHLYIPERLSGPAPAILFYNGHWWAESKTLPDFQAFCITMARYGFIVFSFDPFGQGERGVSARDHRRTTSLLVGVAQQGFAEYETRCALQYLLSRKEVDPDRIGMTGASGGGYNTWITSALDDRIKVAVPVVGTSEFYGQIHYARTVDWYHAGEHCHFLPGLVTFANNHELLAMAAPRPILIINSTTDPGFQIGDVYEYGRGLYRAFGKENRIAFFHDTTAGHGYQQKKREAAYGWFLKWLMNRGDGSPVAEQPLDVDPWDASELKSFDDGRKHASGPAMEAFVRSIADRTGSGPLMKPSKFFGSKAPVCRSPHVQSQPAQRLLFTLADGIVIPAYLLRAHGEKGVLFALDDRGKESLASDALVARALDRGWAVCGLDVRGIGELATAERGWLFAVGLLAGDNFIWRQAGDLIAAAKALLSAPPFAGKSAALYARGDDAALAATYAIGEQNLFGWYVLRNGFVSYRQFLDRPQSLPASFRLLEQDRREDRLNAFDREIPSSYLPFNVLASFDLPQLLASSPATGFILDAIDGDWKAMPPPEAQRLLSGHVTAIQSISEIEKRCSECLAPIP
jgi:dienelactone hydrolase